jgi:sarcosine oxidase subunit alpha
VTTSFRTAEGGRIDRSAMLNFTFDGQPYTGHPGDTLASALLAAGQHQVTTSIKLGRPRGIAAAWAEDPSSLVQIEVPFPEPMLVAATIELYDGLVRPGYRAGAVSPMFPTVPATTQCTITSMFSSSAPARRV